MFKPGDRVYHFNAPLDIGTVLSEVFIQRNTYIGTTKRVPPIVVTVRWDMDMDRTFEHTIESLRHVEGPNELMKEIL